MKILPTELPCLAHGKHQYPKVTNVFSWCIFNSVSGSFVGTILLIWQNYRLGVMVQLQ